MGLNADGTPNTIFRPNDTVTRAEFGTVLSRLLYGSTHNSMDVGDDNWFSAHLQALEDAEIMTKIEAPFMQELRGRVMLMLMRSAQ